MPNAEIRVDTPGATNASRQLDGVRQSMKGVSGEAEVTHVKLRSLDSQLSRLANRYLGITAAIAAAGAIVNAVQKSIEAKQNLEKAHATTAATVGLSTSQAEQLRQFAGGGRATREDTEKILQGIRPGRTPVETAERARRAIEAQRFTLDTQKSIEIGNMKQPASERALSEAGQRVQADPFARNASERYILQATKGRLSDLENPSFYDTGEATRPERNAEMQKLWAINEALAKSRFGIGGFNVQKIDSLQTTNTKGE